MSMVNLVCPKLRRLPVRGPFEDQLIALPGIGTVDRPGRKFQNGVRGQTHGKPPGRKRANGGANAVFAVEINQVDREFHEKCVYGFAGNDPEPGPVVEPAMLQKTGSALRAGFGGIDVAADGGPASYVAHLEFQVPFL